MSAGAAELIADGDLSPSVLAEVLAPLVADKEAYDLLRMTEGEPVSSEALVEEIVNEVRAVGTYAEVLTSLRRFKRRETLRIAYGDIVRNQVHSCRTLGVEGGTFDWDKYRVLSRRWNVWGTIALIAPVLAMIGMIAKP